MTELLKINVSEHIEKKNGLSYLSWAWAWAEVLKVDPKAKYEVRMFGDPFGGSPVCMIGETAMVCVIVTVNDLPRECWLPVMDNRNNAIRNPDARKVSDTIMRCMTKAVALHGLGLYIYAGEDLPEQDEAPPAPRRNGVVADVQSTLPPLSLQEKEYYVNLASDVEDHAAAGDIVKAYDLIVEAKLDQEQRIHLEAELHSAVRSALKKEGDRRRAQKQAKAA